LLKLMDLKDSIENCLDFQDGIQTTEVLELYQDAFNKANRVKTQPVFPTSLEESFTSLIDSFDLDKITLAHKSSAENLVRVLESKTQSINFQVKDVQQQIGEHLQTLEVVIARKFKSRNEPICMQEAAVFESEKSIDRKYIKSALNGRNPRLESIADVEKFFKSPSLGMRLSKGGKHLAIFKGDVKICALALSTVESDKLYLKKVVLELYEDHQISAEALHVAIKEYFK